MKTITHRVHLADNEKQGKTVNNLLEKFKRMNGGTSFTKTKRHLKCVSIVESSKRQEAVKSLDYPRPDRNTRSKKGRRLHT